MPADRFPNLTVLTHPLIQHKVSLLRDRLIQKRDFKALMSEIAMLMTYEVTRDVKIEPVEVVTPLERMTGRRIASQHLTLIPILRAGLGMVEGISRLLPFARVGHLGMYRDHETLQPVSYYTKLPPMKDADCLVLDPMLATGGSAVAAVSLLKAEGAARLKFLCMVAAPPGVQAMAAAHPDVPVYAAALDRELNEHGYIIPGLGDAGDRLFGTR